MVANPPMLSLTHRHADAGTVALVQSVENSTYIVMCSDDHGFRVWVWAGSGPGCLFGTHAKPVPVGLESRVHGHFAGKYFHLLILHFY
jgi:hypothetical protein